MVITSHSHLKARLNTWGNQGSEREVALPRHIEQVAKAGGDRWQELEGEAVSPLGLWGEGSPLPHPPPHQGRSWGSGAAPTDGILQRKRTRREGSPWPANVS